MRVFTLATALVALLLLTMACDEEEAPQASPTPTVPAAATPTATPSPAAITNVCEPNPDPATTDVLVVNTPEPGQAVKSPFTVSGRIAAFEATFKITIFDADGKPIVDVVARSQEGQVLSPFSEEVTFPPEEAGASACLWVYEASARDGSPIHVGQVPIFLLPP